MFSREESTLKERNLIFHAQKDFSSFRNLSLDRNFGFNLTSSASTLTLLAHMSFVPEVSALITENSYGPGGS